MKSVTKLITIVTTKDYPDSFEKHVNQLIDEEIAGGSQIVAKYSMSQILGELVHSVALFKVETK